jgi:hypothetical protein
MPLLRYFGWVGSFLLAMLFAANWYFPARIAPPSDVLLDQLITVRIHTDHKWPERLVFGAAVAIPAQEANADIGTRASGTRSPAERRTPDAFVRMAGHSG